MQFNPYKPPEAPVQDVWHATRRLPILLALPLGALAWRGLPFLFSLFPLTFPTRPGLMISAAILATAAALSITKFCKGSSHLQLALMLLGAVAYIFLLGGSPSLSHKLSVLSKPVFLTFSVCALAVFGVYEITRRTRR